MKLLDDVFNLFSDSIQLMLPACAFELTIVDDVLFPDEMDNWQNEEKIKYKKIGRAHV